MPEMTFGYEKICSKQEKTGNKQRCMQCIYIDKMQKPPLSSVMEMGSFVLIEAHAPSLGEQNALGNSPLQIGRTIKIW